MTVLTYKTLFRPNALIETQCVGFLFSLKPLEADLYGQALLYPKHSGRRTMMKDILLLLTLTHCRHRKRDTEEKQYSRDSIYTRDSRWWRFSGEVVEMEDTVETVETVRNVQTLCMQRNGEIQLSEPIEPVK